MSEPILVVDIEGITIKLESGKPDEIRAQVNKLGLQNETEKLAVIRILTRKVKEAKMQKKLSSNLEPAKAKPKKLLPPKEKVTGEQPASMTFNPQADWQNQFHLDRSQHSIKSHLTKEELVARHKQANPTKTFERLWYHATEGQKHKHAFLDAVFRQAHPFHPDIGVNKRLKLDSTREDLFSRLTYSRNRTEESYLGGDSGMRSSPRTNWRRLGRSEDKLDDHSRRRADKVVQDLLQEISDVRPKKIRFAPEVDLTYRQSIRDTSNRRRESVHKSEIVRPERGSSRQSRGRDSASQLSVHESSVFSRGSQSKPRAETSVSKRKQHSILEDPEGFLLTDRYRKLLGYD